MKTAIACSFSRAGISRAVDLGDRLEQHVPALEEQRVEHLVLGLEVVVDEPVGDARLVGDVRHAAGVEALAREHAHRGVEDDPALVDGRLWSPPLARHLARPAVGLRAGGWPARAACGGSRPGARGRARRATKVSVSGACASTTPHGSTIIERPPERMPGACSPTWLAATTNAWSSIARARSSTSQWSRVVASVNAAGTAITRAPLHREDPVELGEAQVVTDGQAELDAVGGLGDDDLVARAPRARTRGRRVPPTSTSNMWILR